MIKRFLAFLLILGFLLGGSGCMSIFGKTKQTMAEEIILEHLEEKYGEPFSAAGTYGEKTSDVEMYVTCESLPGTKVHVRAYNWKNPNREIRDNYLMYKNEEALREYVREQVSKEFKNAIIHVDICDLTLSPELPADASLEQILQDENAKLWVQVDIPACDFIDLQQAKRVIEVVQQDATTYDFLFIAVEDEKHGLMTGQELLGCYNRKEMVRAASLYRINGRVREVWKEAEE